MTKEIFIGLRKENYADVEATRKAESFAKIANEEVIPLLDKCGIEHTKEAICSAVANRKWVIDFVVNRTLNSKEYKDQPELLKKAVSNVITEDVEGLVGKYGANTLQTGAEYCTFGESGVVACKELLNARREIRLTDAEQIAVFEDYKAVIEGLNKLYGKRVPDVHALASLFNLSFADTSGELKVIPENFIANVDYFLNVRAR